MINLYKGDCLIEMNKIEDKSVDMILADLPYGATVCKWDIVIPFEPLWQHYKRIIKDNGAIVLFGSEPFSSHLRLSNLKWYKYDWIWEKTSASGFLNAKKMPLNNYEKISVFYNKTGRYKPQMREGFKPYVCKRGRPSELYTGQQDVVITKSDGTRFPVLIIKFKKDTGLHPTQKPVALLEYLIKTYTNEGDTVLDNVMGSGSTGVACVNTNRNFIGIEMDEKYFEIAENRINEKLKEREMENEGN